MTSISVVICCFNSRRTIERCLTAIFRAKQFHEVEIILVDNNCTDETVSISRMISQEFGLNVIITVEEKQGLSFARRAGVRLCQNELISFIDDDNYISPNYFERIVEAYENGFGLIGVETHPSAEVEQYMNQNNIEVDYAGTCAIGKLYKTDTLLSPCFPIVWGAGLVIERKTAQIIFENWKFFLTGRLGGQMLSGDDGEICLLAQYLGLKGKYLATPLLVHDVALDRFSREVIKKTQYGAGYMRSTLAIVSIAVFGMRSSYQNQIIWLIVMYSRIYSSRSFFLRSAISFCLKHRNQTFREGFIAGLELSGSISVKQVRESLRTLRL